MSACVTHTTVCVCVGGAVYKQSLVQSAAITEHLVPVAVETLGQREVSNIGVDNARTDPQRLRGHRERLLRKVNIGYGTN